MKKTTWLWLLLMVGLTLSPLWAARFTGWCVKVDEGDAIVVWVNKKRLNVHLESVDAPDPGQPFADPSREWLHSQLFKKKVSVDVASYSDEKFLLGRVYLDDRDMSLELVRAGMAWYAKDRGTDREIAKAQRKARKDKVGLWTQKDPVPPWEYRKGKVSAR